MSPGDQASEVIDTPAKANAMRVLELQRKIENLERAIASQRTIGVAVGMLAQRYDCTTEQAWVRLSRLSQMTNTKAREVARVLRDAFDDVPHGCDPALMTALQRYLPDWSWGPATEDDDDHLSDEGGYPRPER